MALALYNRISPRRERVKKDPLFPLDVECRVYGFDDDPDQEYIGYFRKVENHFSIIFHYNDKFRLAHLDYLGNLVVTLVGTGERWEYYNIIETKRTSFLQI